MRKSEAIQREKSEKKEIISTLKAILPGISADLMPFSMTEIVAPLNRYNSNDFVSPAMIGRGRRMKVE